MMVALEEKQADRIIRICPAEEFMQNSLILWQLE